MTEKEKFNRLMDLLTINPIYVLKTFQILYIQKVCEQIFNIFKDVLIDIENEQNEKEKERKQQAFIRMVNKIIEEKENEHSVYGERKNYS